MAVYDGVPSIRLEGDEARALALIPEAKVLLYKVQGLKKLAGVGTFSMSQRVNADATIYVLSANDQNIIQIAVAPTVPQLLDQTAIVPGTGSQFPEFYSGMVFSGRLESRLRETPDGRVITIQLCVNFVPTPNCQATHTELAAGRQDVHRLAVRPSAGFDVLDNPAGAPVYSQYTKLRSSMYSGKMKKVAQVVMGLGRIQSSKLLDPSNPTSVTNYMKDVHNYGVQVRYDWRFIRTHGITVGADGRLWLVEISLARGVLARPLPIFPKSTTGLFLAQAAQRGDTAMEHALEELGCLPTGEAFPPTDATLTELITKGEILQLMTAEQLEPFYQCSAYSSVMGWAFNERGSEAHNTGYYFHEDGFQRSVWYQISISIGAVITNRVDGDPIAVASAVLRKQAEGYIYTPPVISTSPARFVPIKFFEPLLPGLMSHEGVPAPSAFGLTPPKVDTPMFVSFVDDDLKVIKYYRNSKNGAFNEVDDPRYPGECILAGSWTVTETTGTRSFPAMMYTNEFDDRKVLQEHTKITTIDSQDLGFDPPRFFDFIQSPETAYVSRNRVFKRTTTIDNRGGESIVSAIVIPQYSREAYYYATANRYNGGRSGTTAVAYDVLKDPNVGYAWRCFPRINSPPFPAGRPDCNTSVCRGSAPCIGGVGYHSERRVVCLAHEPEDGVCSEYADAGTWLTVCQTLNGFNAPGMRKTATNTNWNLGADATAKLFLISPGHGGPLQLNVTADQVYNHWMAVSPDPLTGNVQFADAVHSAIGDDALVCTTGLSSYSGGTRFIGYAPDTLQQGEMPTFVGVNKS